MMTDGTTKPRHVDDKTTYWDDALLFEVAVDPFQQIAKSGREEGRAAGRRDGYLEGVNIGRSKGWEIGLELGYIHDFVQGILDGYQPRMGHQQPQRTSLTSQPLRQSKQKIDGNISQEPEHRTSHRLERCLTLARDLVKMINEFPDPDTLLSQNNGDSVNSTINNTNKEENEDNEDGKATDAFGKGDASMTSNPAAMLDISASLERIRAKFKLLCVLLRTKHQFDLKNVLDSGSGPGNGRDTGGIGEGISKPVEQDDQSVDASSTNDAVSDQRDKRKESNPGDQDIGYTPGKDSSGLGSDW